MYLRVSVMSQQFIAMDIGCDLWTISEQFSVIKNGNVC